jgi:hypothetical protein
VTRDGGVVAVLEKRGRFVMAVPFFGRGGGIPVERDRRAGNRDVVMERPTSLDKGRA